MKKNYPIAVAFAAFSAFGIVLAASGPDTHRIESSRSLSQYSMKIATTGVQHVEKDTRKRVSAPEDATAYWSNVRSNFDSKGKFSYRDGVQREFGTRIKIEDNKATIYNLVDLYFMDIVNEYPIEGVYDNKRNTITITGTQYDSEQPASSFIKVADMHDSTKGADYTLMLFAGEMNNSGQLNTENELVLKVSDDMKTITSKCGFGAYAFQGEEPVAFYDFYATSMMERVSDELSVSVSPESINFNGMFVFAGSQTTGTFKIYNKSNVSTRYSIHSQSDEMKFTPSEGTLDACSVTDIELNYTPSQPGYHDDAITIDIEGMESPVTLKLDVEVQERPDYMKIVKADSQPITFDMSPLYPFVITEYDGHVAAMSTNEGKGDNTESYFICNVEVPAGKTGVFSWSAAQLASQPNAMVILLDGDEILSNYSQTSDSPSDMSGTCIVEEGRHQIAFVNAIYGDWSIYDQMVRSYVWDLNLDTLDSAENSVYAATDSHTFRPTYFDKFDVMTKEYFTLYNTGKNNLEVYEVIPDGNFSGKAVTSKTPYGESVNIPITWTAKGVGEDTGEIIIKTSGGDVTVKCKAEARALASDFSKIVKDGTFSFNTDIAYPFVISEGDRYAYNSSSKADIDGITFSWLEASFEVPEGKVCELEWDALNDSDIPFVFMGIPSIISGTMISIDGGNECAFGGEEIECGSKYFADQASLVFKPGIHNIKFNYKKTSNEDNFVFGDDRLKLFELNLISHNIEDFKARLSSDTFIFPNEVLTGLTGHLPVTLYNYTDIEPEIISQECDGPFAVKTVEIKDGNMDLMVEFSPAETGEYENILTLHTNIGDYSITCSGKGLKSEFGNAIFYESFEYDFERNWIIEDGNSDGNGWMNVKGNEVQFSNYDVNAADGTGALMIAGYNPSTFEHYEWYDVAATPDIEIPSEGNTVLRFFIKNNTYNPQTLTILVGEGDDFESYDEIKSLTFDSATEWISEIISLNDYAGRTIQIAFKAETESGMIMIIDDVLVANDKVGAVNIVSTDKSIVSKEYYSTDGKRLNSHGEGIFIEVTRYSDGSSKTRKINTLR